MTIRVSALRTELCLAVSVIMIVYELVLHLPVSHVVLLLDSLALCILETVSLGIFQILATVVAPLFGNYSGLPSPFPSRVAPSVYSPFRC